MRILATALTAATLAVMSVQAEASTPTAAPQQAKPHTDAGQLHEG